MRVAEPLPHAAPRARRRPGLPADRGRSYAELERNAAVMRARWSQGAHCAFPALAIFERLDALTARWPVPVEPAVNPLPPGIEAVTLFSPDAGRLVVALDPSTYSALEREAPRARFSLCHELGHALLHLPVLRRLARLPLRQMMAGREAARHGIWCDAEWQADVFAGALLMPAPGLDATLAFDPTYMSVLSRFGVSFEAAHTRIRYFRRRRGELLRAASRGGLPCGR
ncbi:MAG: ImmA/IrrE family metallo-endopeptidase [Myxococcales bacterium]|nr:ImmA/IrrE family metallo-endopeptidase [Myxococcales bacterium]